MTNDCVQITDSLIFTEVAHHDHFHYLKEKVNVLTTMKFTWKRNYTLAQCLRALIHQEQEQVSSVNAAQLAICASGAGLTGCIRADSSYAMAAETSILPSPSRRPLGLLVEHRRRLQNLTHQLRLKTGKHMSQMNRKRPQSEQR